MDKTTMNAQIERFRKGFPWLKIVAPAIPGNGIEVLDEAAQDAAVHGEVRASETRLDDDLPDAGDAEKKFVAGIRRHRPGAFRKSPLRRPQ